MTDIVPIPAAPTVPIYPPLGSATFNADAYTYGSSMPGVVFSMNLMLQAGYTNAVAANERAVAANSAAGSAVTAKGQAETAAGTATQQAGLAVTAKGQAETAAGTATQQAGLATTAKGQAETAAGTATQQAGLAATARQGSEAARDTALSLAAFAFESTSTTSLTIGLGAKVFAIEAGKSFAVGQYVSAVSTADTSIWMAGPVTAHDRSTGQITLQVNATMGAGTLASWRLVLAANGAAAGVQTIAAGTYTDADLAPLNSVTVITGVNSAFATTHLPVITANSASAGWGTSYDWVVETLGFGAGAGIRAKQTAVPSVVGNAAGTGLGFVRRRVGATWGRWKPAGALPTSTLTVTGGDMYGSTLLGLNRTNQIAVALNGSVASWSFPATPEDGDRFRVVTNSRADNTLAYKDKPVIGNGYSLAASGDSVQLNRAFAVFGFTYNLFNDSWMAD